MARTKKEERKYNVTKDGVSATGGDKPVTLHIRPINLKVLSVPIVGTAPYCQHKFSAKMREIMLGAQIDPTQKKGKRNKGARDIAQEFIGAQHISSAGWIGIPAAAFRCAAIDACRLVDFKMTLAKMSIFVEHDGLDADDGQPLVRLIAGEPEMNQMVGRLANGTAMVVIRPLWREWGAMVRVRYDADQFSAEDVINLMNRAGQQIGVGEGRPFSKNSAGLGWGTFVVDAEATGKNRG